RAPLSTLFPYTTLFRSHLSGRLVPRACGDPRGLRPLGDPPRAAVRDLAPRRTERPARAPRDRSSRGGGRQGAGGGPVDDVSPGRSEEHTSELQSRVDLV